MNASSRLVLAVILTLALAAPAAAQPWPWGGRSDQIMGGVGLVVALSLNYPPSKDGLGITPSSINDPPRLDSFRLYPCGAPGCQDGDRLDLPFIGPFGLERGVRLHYLYLSLPPALYRIDRVEGVAHVQGHRVAFEFPLHYIFEAREGRTSYLGRLKLTMRQRASRFEDRAARGETLDPDSPGGRPLTIPDLSFDFEVVDRLEADGPALMRAYPERTLRPFAKELMFWLKPLN